MTLKKHLSFICFIDGLRRKNDILHSRGNRCYPPFWWSTGGGGGHFAV